MDSTDQQQLRTSALFRKQMLVYNLPPKEDGKPIQVQIPKVLLTPTYQFNHKPRSFILPYRNILGL